MRTRPAALSLGLALGTGLAAQSPGTAQAPGRDALVPYTGAYTVAPHHELVVALQQAPGLVALVLYDIQTDAVRLLMPSGRDRFVGGAELTRPQPATFEATFVRDAAGRIASLRLSGAGWRDTAVAQRRPLREEPVSFTNDGVTLTGTLILPPGDAERAARGPAVVFVHGSEDSDRYSFGALPHLVAAHGFVAFTFDKRGTGGSTGSWQDSSLDELANDVRAAVAVVARHDGVDAARIGLIGLSEGGWTAPRAASRGPGVAFIVTFSGGGLTKGDAFIHKNRVRLVEAGLAGTALDSALAESVRTISESLARVRAGRAPTGFDRRIAYDPAADWAAFRGPILSLGGEADALEDAPASAARLRETLTRAGHPDFTIKVFPRAHHAALFEGVTGKPSEWYGLRGITKVVAGAWDVLLRWLDVRYGPREMPRRTGDGDL